jgi:hypothetical protein
VLDAYAGISRRQLAAELPVSGRSAPIQHSGLCEQKSADTHSTEPPHLDRHLLQPGRQRRVTNRSRAESADQEHGVAHAFDSAEVMPGDEGQHTALALDRQVIRVGDDLNRVGGPARKAIDRVEHLEGPNQIELIDRRHDHDDDPAARGGATPARFLGRGGHASTHYLAAAKRFASGTCAMADFDGSVAQIALSSSVGCLPGAVD